MTHSVRSWKTFSSSTESSSSSSDGEEIPAYIIVPNPTLDGSLYKPTTSSNPSKPFLAGGVDGWQNIANADDRLTSRYRCDDQATWTIEIPTQAGDTFGNFNLKIGRGHDGAREDDWLEVASSSFMKDETETYSSMEDAVGSTFPGVGEEMQDEVAQRLTTELLSFRNLALAPHYGYFVDGSDSPDSEEDDSSSSDDA